MLAPNFQVIGRLMVDGSILIIEAVIGGEKNG